MALPRLQDLAYSRKGLQEDKARWQLGNAFAQFGAWRIGTHPRGLACFVHVAHIEGLLCEANSKGYDLPNSPLKRVHEPIYVSIVALSYWKPQP
jgi:hypothetical protein